MIKGKSFKINDEIEHDYVRVVGENINKVMSLDEAKDIANNFELDLVEINSNSNPPIIKLCKYEKLVYELKKNEKKNKQSAIQVKEIQLSTNIATHDLETKAKQGINFINKGYKVKVILTMKGRELTRREASKRSFYAFLDILSQVASVEMSKDENNKSIAILKKKKD